MADNETIAEIIAEMRDEAARADMEQGYSLDDAAEMMREFAWRIEAARKRELDELRKQVGNAAKLRETLEMVRDAHFVREENGEDCEGFEVEADDGTGRPLICVVEDVLAAPPRNCERFQTTEQAKEAYFAEVRHVSVWDGCETERLVDWLLCTATEKEGGNDGR